jgi:hypothetical protein
MMLVARLNEGCVEGCTCLKDSVVANDRRFELQVSRPEGLAIFQLDETTWNDLAIIVNEVLAFMYRQIAEYEKNGITNIPVEKN